MSLLNRIEGQSCVNVLHSITEQIASLFANKLDTYWAFDFKNRKIFPIHQLFSLDKFSESFLWELARTIEVWDSRVLKAVCSWNLNEVEAPILEVRCILKEAPAQMQFLSLSLKSL